MSSLDVERRLTEVLHRHAEDAMSSTDTQGELREFLARGPKEPRPRTGRGTAVVGAALASAAVAAAVVWGADLTDDRADPAPSQQPVTAEEAAAAVEVAEDVVTAVAAGDVERIESALAPGASPWLRWRADLRVFEALGFEHLLQPCQALGRVSTGTEVTCPFDNHALHSEELGRGPFAGNFYTFVVRDGEVQSGKISLNYEANGQSDHFDAVLEWVRVNQPDDYALMGTEFDLLVGDQARTRWLTLWGKNAQAHLEARSQE